MKPARNFLSEPILAIAMLVFAVAFNLWLYRLEPTAKVDPNDNLFQYALVYRTNQIWDIVQKNFPRDIPLLFDHWVPNWNEGFNLPYYYSHVPQIVIVGTWRIFHIGSLFQYYHLIIYLLLSMFPVAVFLGIRVAGQSWLTAGFGALLASQVSTDGLYGLDPPSFLWRGYGLSSQLFAMIFLPLAIAFALRYFRTGKNLGKAVAFLVATTAGHLGIGIIAFMSLVPLALWEVVIAKQTQKTAVQQGLRIAVLACIAIALLSYWILPAMVNDKYHAFSFWDPVWKFNSYGMKENITRLFSGDLFDFGRLPVFTALVVVGLFVHPEFSLLFIFWFLMYFGRTTWGGLIDVIPAMKEFHLSRFIVGVHMAGIFLAPVGLTWIMKKLRVVPFLPLIALIPLIPIYQQTIRYNDLNNTLILRANANYDTQAPDINKLVTTMQSLPAGRVYAGRGSSWNFKIAETNMIMYLGNFALPTTMWLPETWSPNGDTEQYFREDHSEDYDLYNIKYVAAPPTLSKDQTQPFWKLIKENPGWKLYEVTSSGYFTTGVRPAIVSADKYNRTNVVRLWIQSDDSKNGLYPELTFDTKSYPVNAGLPNFKMLDEVTYQVPDGSIHNLFSENPRYINPLSNLSTLSNLKILSQSEQSDMVFKANVSVPANCTECMVVLKQSYHPEWHVTVDGNAVNPIITFPFYIGIPVTEGTHAIVVSYEPSPLKIVLLYGTIASVIGFFVKSLLTMR